MSSNARVQRPARLYRAGALERRVRPGTPGPGRRGGPRKGKAAGQGRNPPEAAAKPNPRAGGKPPPPRIRRLPAKPAGAFRTPSLTPTISAPRHPTKPENTKSLRGAGALDRRVRQRLTSGAICFAIAAYGPTENLQKGKMELLCLPKLNTDLYQRR